MSATANPEDIALHNKLHIEAAIEELARRHAIPDADAAFVTALGASLHYLFEIAAERHGEDGVRFLERLVPLYVHHALTGEMPEGQGG